MTRINSAIPPIYLTDEHLLAEHREIKRICRFADKRNSNIPNQFKLGTGHVLFFSNKPNFTYNRYLSLYEECLNRNFEVQFYGDNWDSFSNRTDNYIPTETERNLLLERISDRLLGTKKPNWHYYGKSITKEEAKSLLYKTLLNKVA